MLKALCTRHCTKFSLKDLEIALLYFIPRPVKVCFLNSDVVKPLLFLHTNTSRNESLLSVSTS